MRALLRGNMAVSIAGRPASERLEGVGQYDAPERLVLPIVPLLYGQHDRRTAFSMLTAAML